MSERSDSSDDENCALVCFYFYLYAIKLLEYLFHFNCVEF